MKYIVTIENGGFTYWLRGTIWAGGLERATLFDSRELAEAGLKKARATTIPKLFKIAKVSEYQP